MIINNMRSHLNILFVTCACLLAIVGYFTVFPPSLQIWRRHVTTLNHTSDDITLRHHHVAKTISRSQGRISAVIEESTVVPHCIDKKPLYKTGPFSRQKANFDRYLKPDELNKSDLRKKVFNGIFKNHVWGGDTKWSPVSGEGSMLKSSVKMRQIIDGTISRLKTELNESVIRMLDAPCGDLNWMREFLKDRDDIHYTGFDIVPNLIDRHQKEFKGIGSRNFILGDIVNSVPDGKFNLVHTRHLIQHLSESAVAQTLINIEKTKSSYLLVTDYPTYGKNSVFQPKDTGGMHMQNLQAPFYSLVPPVCMAFDTHSNYASLYKLPLEQVVNCTTIKGHDVLHTGQFGAKLYSCA